MRDALDDLIKCLGAPQQTDTHMLPTVFVVFDEAHTLTNLRTDGNRTPFTELRSALKDVGSNRFFAFFLSTTSKISQFVVPKQIDGSDRMVGESTASLPFSDVGFDHLMHDRKIFDKFKSIDDVTSTECVAHMGRPL